MTEIHIAKNLRKLRQSKGKTLQYMGDMCAKTRATYGCYERGLSEPSLPTLMLIADYFGVTIDDLIRKEL